MRSVGDSNCWLRGWLQLVARDNHVDDADNNFSNNNEPYRDSYARELGADGVAKWRCRGISLPGRQRQSLG